MIADRQWPVGSFPQALQTRPRPTEGGILRTPVSPGVPGAVACLVSGLLLATSSPLAARPAFLMTNPVVPSGLAGTQQIDAPVARRLLVPVAVFGKDQRRRLPKPYKKLDQQIGLLHNRATNTLCTAFCVAPDMIATASHCLFGNKKRRRLHLSSFLFKLKTGQKNRSSYARLAGSRSKQTRQYIITGTSKLNRRPPIGAAKDWAIVRLQRDACKNGWLKTVSLSHERLQRAARDRKLFQVAYHMDFQNWKIAYSRACSVNRTYGGLSWRKIRKHFASPKSLILHQCDTGEASSGSPLLMDSHAGPVVVGINVGTYQQREVVLRNGKVIRRSKYRTIANTAVSSAAFIRKISLLQRADIIEKRDDMKALQSGLKDRKFYNGAVDGIYGARTERAIKSFERATNRPVTGLATLSLLADLARTGSEPVSIDTSADYDRRSHKH